MCVYYCRIERGRTRRRETFATRRNTLSNAAKGKRNRRKKSVQSLNEGGGEIYSCPLTRLPLNRWFMQKKSRTIRLIAYNNPFCRGLSPAKIIHCRKTSTNGGGGGGDIKCELSGLFAAGVGSKISANVQRNNNENGSNNDGNKRGRWKERMRKKTYSHGAVAFFFFVRILHTYCMHNRYTGIGIRVYYNRYYYDSHPSSSCRSVDVCAIHSNGTVHYYNNGDERVYVHTAFS